MSVMEREEPTSRTLPFLIDAAAAARVLAASGSPWCWLDGEAAVLDGEEDARSYLGAASEIRVAERGREREFLDGLRRTADARTGFSGSGVSGSRVSGSGFSGGWVVALGYEFGVGLMGLDPAPDEAAPAFALRLGIVLVVDHRTGSAELRGGSAEELDAWWAEHGRALETATRARPPAAGAESSPLWRRTDDEYAKQVEHCKRAIREGEAYVLCLTDTATLPGSFEPLELYTALRSGGGALRGGVIVAGERALVSASPERFLSVRRGAGGVRTVETHPIKGTRPRGATPEEDAALAAELAADPKERAENLMIVDLMRNDLSRVCEPDTVGVDGFLRVETHRHVHQLVSTVSGELRPGTDVFDAVEACFPGGSMTGAPKRRAVEILASLEGGPRGLYSGCFGWIDREGDAELAMTIRCVELRGAEARASRIRGANRGRRSLALVGAGGGITVDSDPASEVAEKHLKAAPSLAGLGAVSRYS